MSRPTKDDYYMEMARSARARADCHGRKVGAVLVMQDRIVATGYNGVPSGMLNCTDGGCERCKKATPGQGYDVCICVHAEANVLLTAARFGTAVDGATVYTTLAPCFTCAKELLQAGIVEVCYGKEFDYPDQTLACQQRKIMAQFQLPPRLVPATD